MRYTGRKGWQASRQDTFNLDDTLKPIILAGLVRFREVLQEAKDKDGCYGVPFKEGSTEGMEPEEWFELLDKMIYAFGNTEPDTMDYDFQLDWIEQEPTDEGTIPVRISCSNDEEWQRYNKDMDEWRDKVQEGCELFGKYYQSLWR